MKGHKKCIIIYLVALLLLMGCTNSNTDNALQIHPPLNNHLTIRGTWEVIKDTSNEWRGKTLQFTEDYLLLGEDILQNPSYKIRRVNVEEYIFYHLRNPLSDFSINLKDMDVITITDKGQFIGEVLILQENELILQLHNNSILLKKTSDEVELSFDVKGDYPESILIENFKDSEGIRSGLLIALRSSGGNNSTTYRTIFVAVQNKELRTSLEADGILFPRRSGFWQLSTERKVVDGFTEDYIYANNTLTNQQSINSISKQRSLLGLSEPSVNENTNISRSIQYVGNDYISIEEVVEKDGFNTESMLSIIPVDALPNIKKIDINDLLGEKGTTTIETTRMKVMVEKGISDKYLSRFTKEDSNLSLERKMGRWIFKSRLSYMQKNQLKTEDFNINLIPPNNLVSYDSLAISWTNVKDKIPNAIDVYTSPNKDIAVIITKTELLVYRLSMGEIIGVPLERIVLNTGESIIMAEWATGQYTDIWEKTFNRLFSE